MKVNYRTPGAPRRHNGRAPGRQPTPQPAPVGPAWAALGAKLPRWAGWVALVVLVALWGVAGWLDVGN